MSQNCLGSVKYSDFAENIIMMCPRYFAIPHSKCNLIDQRPALAAWILNWRGPGHGASFILGLTLFRRGAAQADARPEGLARPLVAGGKDQHAARCRGIACRASGTGRSCGRETPYGAKPLPALKF